MEEVLLSCDEVEVNEENDKSDDSLEANIIHEDEKPQVGMIFSTKDKLIEYYKKYARSIGFGVTKLSSKNGDAGKKYFTLACSRGTNYVSKTKNLLKSNPITKTQCKARLNACICLDGTVTISRIVLEHNHDLSPTKARYFRSNKNLEPHLKRRLEFNDRAGIKVSKNYRSLVVEANGYENLTFGEKDCRNYIDKIRIVKKVARKRTQKSSQKSENCQAQKKGMCASRVQESVRVIDRVGTRKTIQGEQSIFGRNEQGGVNQLAPFNPNTILISKVNQVPFYSQVMNHGGGSYFELLQAQHHVNDPSSSKNHTNMH